MSSESRESQASAHNEHGDAIENGQDTGEHSGEQGDVARETTPAQDVGEEADGDQDLDMTASGAEGFSFARTRRSFPQYLDEESASERPIRPKAERPGSPESASTPDDTPSIQVC